MPNFLLEIGIFVFVVELTYGHPSANLRWMANRVPILLKHLRGLEIVRRSQLVTIFFRCTCRIAVRNKTNERISGVRNPYALI